MHMLQTFLFTGTVMCCAAPAAACAHPHLSRSQTAPPSLPSDPLMAHLAVVIAALCTPESHLPAPSEMSFLYTNLLQETYLPRLFETFVIGVFF